jgi:uncharacterized protein
MRVTSTAPAGRQFVEGYGSGRFRIAGVDHRGAVLVLRTQTIAWRLTDGAPVTDERVTDESLAPMIDAVIAAGEVTVLLLGCGQRMTLVPPASRERLRGAGVVIEPMETGSACRTYNVLLSEDRQVAAALIPLP